MHSIRQNIVEPATGSWTGKSKAVAFVLALGFGWLGFHNFYLRRGKRGLAQLLITLFTLTIGILVTLPWAWVEAVRIALGHHTPLPLGRFMPDHESNEADGASISNLDVLFVLFGLVPGSLIALMLFAIPAIIVLVVNFVWVWISRLSVSLLIPRYSGFVARNRAILIRFSGRVQQRHVGKVQAMKFIRKLSLAPTLWIVFLITLSLQSNIEYISHGSIPDAVLCTDLNVSFNGSCEGGQSLPCNEHCVLEHTTASQRLAEAMLTQPISILLFFGAPLVAALTAPFLLLRFSTLSIVDGSSRSIRPIGEHSADVTNIAMGFGCVLTLLQSTWKVGLAYGLGGSWWALAEGVFSVVMFYALLLMIAYPLVFFSMVRFQRKFWDLIDHMDEKIVHHLNVESHEFTFDRHNVSVGPTMTLDQSTGRTSQSSCTSHQSENDFDSETTNSESGGSEASPEVLVVEKDGIEWMQRGGHWFYRDLSLKGEWLHWVPNHDEDVV